MNKNIPNNLCTACGACVQACPKQCITFTLNEHLEKIPTINKAACIDCGYCEKVCHLNRKSSIDTNKIEAYACISEDKEVMKQVTSGGAFDAIAKYVLSKNGVVYGCAYQNHLEVKHIRVDSVNGLSQLYGSKYVQSDTGETYRQAQKDLKDGLFVLYSGTPCQIAGLKAFLGKEYTNLLTVDLVCHGTPPAAYFDKYVRGYEKKYGVSLYKVAFRDKKNKSSCGSGYIYVEQNGKSYGRKTYYFKNWYYFYFLRGSIYTQGCYSCKYANLNRPGDFTLGDCWGSEKFNLPFSDANGCSLVLVNTEKAQGIFSSLPLEKHPISIVQACKYNGQLVEPTAQPPNSNQLKMDICRLGFDEIEKEFKKKYRKAILFGQIKKATPNFIKKFVKKIRR